MKYFSPVRQKLETRSFIALLSLQKDIFSFLQPINELLLILPGS
jgi:hypothetical protein